MVDEGSKAASDILLMYHFAWSDETQEVNFGPNKIECRSRYDSKPLDLREQYTDQFEKNAEVFVNGARGSAGPFLVDEGECQLCCGLDLRQ
ncbi:MAG: hypothetical protein Q9178_001374 [Gyalolechia marmorata]